MGEQPSYWDKEQEETTEAASPAQIERIVSHIDRHVPIATTMEDYKQTTHGLSHGDVTDLSLKRGIYQNGFILVNVAEISMSRYSPTGKEEPEVWKIQKNGTHYEAARFILNPELDQDKQLDSIVFQRQNGLDVVSKKEAEKMQNTLTRAVQF